MGDLGAKIEGGKRIRTRANQYLTLANGIGLARAAVHSIEIVFLSYPISHRATLHSALTPLRRKFPILGNGIKQRDLIMPPAAVPNGYAGDKSPLKTALDSDLEWFYRRSGTKYARFGNMISSGGTVCDLDYHDMAAIFRYGTSHELEPLLKQRGFQVSYNSNNGHHR